MHTYLDEWQAPDVLLLRIAAELLPAHTLVGHQDDLTVPSEVNMPSHVRT